MISKYYILTPSQKIELFVTTILFFFIFLLLRPMLFKESFYGPHIANLAIIFFVWYGLTLIMTNALTITSDKLTSSSL